MVVYRSPRLDRVFHALSHPARRAIVRQLSTGERNLSELAAPLRMTFPAATKHVRVLEGANLVRRRIVGRQHLCRLHAAPLWEAALDRAVPPELGGPVCGSRRAARGDEEREKRGSTRHTPAQEPSMNPASLNLSTPTDTTIVMTRSFNAPRSLVWDAMTDAAKLSRWMFAPPGWSMTVCEFEPRVGGRYKWAWKNEQADPVMTIHGSMTEVVPHERIVHTQTMDMSQCGPAAEFTVALQFVEKNGLTQMRLTLIFPSKADRDNTLMWGMERGMEVGYARLDAMLARPG
jgi:uncharacterized protein YndB with AHSA1/START domain/DNA-binding transcriptional ArsR family regulator